MSTNWDDIPEGILAEIAKRVPTFDDFKSICEVSHHWSSLLKGFRYSCTTPQVPLLMLPPQHPPNNNQVVEELNFYSLTKDRVHRIKIPGITRRARIFSSHGWLLIVSCYKSISLLNPFSQRLIHLPDLQGDIPDWRFWIEKFTLSSSASNDEEDYTVMVAYNGFPNTLATWRPGDSNWTKLDMICFSDVICSEGVFYVINSQHEVYAIEVQQFWDETLCNKSRLLVRYIADISVSFTGSRCSKDYLVWSRGKLLVINRSSEVGYTPIVLLDELNVDTGEVVPLRDLGNRALFLGINESISLEGIDGCKSNCIYFTDDDYCYWGGQGGRNMGIYNLSDTSFEPYYKGESLSYINPPLWVECQI